MELFTLLAVLAVVFYALKSRDQRRRIALLGSTLGKYQIEGMMQSLTEGYARALGEPDAERQAQIWTLLNTTEAGLCEQFKRFAADVEHVDGLDARVSKLPLAIPYASKLFPAATFDLRQAMAVHAQGISRAVHDSTGLSPKGRAFNMSAELFLMQHTCHWFCRSKGVASARVLVRHGTSYAQLVAAVAPETRKAYVALVGA